MVYFLYVFSFQRHVYVHVPNNIPVIDQQKLYFTIINFWIYHVNSFILIILFAECYPNTSYSVSEFQIWEITMLQNTNTSKVIATLLCLETKEIQVKFCLETKEIQVK